MALRLRRGTNADRLLLDGLTNPLPAEGELLYTTDTKKLFVGDGTTTGGVEVDTGLVDLNNSSIGDLGDVDTTSLLNIPADGEALVWDSTQSRWEPTNLLIPRDISELTDSTNLLQGGAGIQGGGVVAGSNYKINIISDDSSVMLDVSANTLTATGGITTSTIEGDLTSNNISIFNGTVDLSNSVALLMPATVNATTFNGNLTGNVTGNVTGNAAGDHTGTFTGSISATGTLDGDVIGSVFADDSRLIVDGVNGIVTADVIGDVTGNVFGNVQGDVTGNLTGDVSAIQVTSNAIDINKAGIPTFTLTNNQPAVDLYDGDTHGVIVFKTIDTNGTRTSGTFGVADTGFVLTAGDGAGGLPVANKLSITQDGKFGLGTYTPAATLDVQGAIMPGVYADATARDTAIPTPGAGMMIYLTSTNKHQGYNGTVWTDMY